jgi:hypothetical protein
MRYGLWLRGLFQLPADRADVAADLIGTKLLDRSVYFVHILNKLIIYPHNSWIYKVNETSCF